MAPSEITSHPLPLACPVTRWFHWRIAKFAGLFLVGGLWFGYDGLLSYPKENKIAEAHAWFQNEVRNTHSEMEKAGRLDAWPALAVSRGWPIGSDGQPPTWVSFAAGNGWPEKPPYPHSPSSIRTQIYFGLAGIFAAFGVGILAFLNRIKCLRADSDSLTTPEGIHIPFSEVYKIDRRPWRSKGYAKIAFTRSGGRKGKAVIDDLKYAGAHQVLGRLLANFKGIVIDEVSDEDAAAAAPLEKPVPTVAEAAHPAA